MRMSDRFELHGSRSVDQLPDLRRFIEKLHKRLDSDLVARVSMVVHELYENALKFSSDGNASLVIDVVTTNPTHLTVRTTNRASIQNREAVQERFARLKSAGSPMLHYLELMKTSKSLGGLGLGRVAAEGEMTIDLIVDGDLVTICAELDEGNA